MKTGASIRFPNRCVSRAMMNFSVVFFCPFVNNSVYLHRQSKMLNNIVQEMKAEIAQYNEEERREYETSVKNYRDYINTMDYAHDNGVEEGKAIGMAEGEAKANMDNARKMKAKGFSIADIADITGLSTEEIEKL